MKQEYAIMEAYRNLADAVIVMAAEDYQHYLKQILTNPEKVDRKMLKHFRQTEIFFHSRYYHCLTDVDGDYLLDRLRKQVYSDINQNQTA
ncbi:hypothetical protein I6E50_08195 [Roseburia hominis]|uniref:hypothetical protein n=1 Tax=Roseburia hominis TaxID=301301 RepID=UPI001F430613|nr:hypothetical protein [Roseburia hominis]